MSDKTYTEVEITQMINAKAILEGLVGSYFCARYDADCEAQA